MALLKTTNVSLGYGGMKVVGGLNFSVSRGDYLCIVGENGSGKSTLIKTMLGLIPPLEGSIALGDGLQQKEIGYLPQQTEMQRDFPASVWEIVLSGCLNHCGLRPFYNRREKDLARSNLECLGISDLSAQCYRELSGGQQQRVLLARSLCAAQKVLLLDEPAAGLDPKAAADMYQIIKELNEESDITIIMVSHDIAAAAKYASHILHIGAVPLFFGSRQDYLLTDIGRLFEALGGGDAT